jgi:RNA-binding protein
MTAETHVSPAPLSSKQRKQLRGLAHALNPLVHVGHEGVSEGVVAATDRALLDHELIKVRLHEPDDKRGFASDLATRCNATLCGLVGHTLILYRAHPETPRIKI